MQDTIKVKGSVYKFSQKLWDDGNVTTTFGLKVYTGKVGRETDPSNGKPVYADPIWYNVRTNEPCLLGDGDQVVVSGRFGGKRGNDGKVYLTLFANSVDLLKSKSPQYSTEQDWQNNCPF